MQLKFPGSLITVVALGMCSFSASAAEATTFQVINTSAGQFEGVTGGLALFLDEATVAQVTTGTWSSFWALGGGLIGLSLVARRIRS